MIIKTKINYIVHLEEVSNKDASSLDLMSVGNKSS